jgi:hypothetical protein
MGKFVSEKEKKKDRKFVIVFFLPPHQSVSACNPPVPRLDDWLNFLSPRQSKYPLIFLEQYEEKIDKKLRSYFS